MYMCWLSSLEYACNCSIEYVDVAFHLSLGLAYHMYWVFTRCPRLPYRGFVFGGALLCASCLSTRSQAFSCWVVYIFQYPQIVYLLIVWLAACQALVRRCMIWHVHPFLFLCVGTFLLPTIICERFHGSCFIWILQPHALCSQFASYLGSISIGTLIVAHSFHFHSFFPLPLLHLSLYGNIIDRRLSSDRRQTFTCFSAHRIFLQEAHTLRAPQLLNSNV